MPQPNTLTVGCEPEMVGRFRDLSQRLGVTQKALLSALINLPDNEIKKAVDNQAARSISKKDKRSLAQEINKRELTSEQAAAIKKVLGDIE